jgi:thioredoxin 1
MMAGAVRSVVLTLRVRTYHHAERDDYTGEQFQRGVIMGFTSTYAEREPTRAQIDALAGPLVVEFGAPWCGHCAAVQPALAELLARFPHVQHIKIHDGTGQPLGRSFGVKLWPNLVFLRDGKLMLQLARPGEGEIRQGLDAISAATDK